MSSSVSTDAGRPGRSFLTKYFLLILLGFACLSLLLSSRFTHHEVQDASIIQSHLRESVQSLVMRQQNDNPTDKIPNLKKDVSAAAQTVAKILTKKDSTNDNTIDMKEAKTTKNTDSTVTKNNDDKGTATLLKSKDTSVQETFKIGQNNDSTASNTVLKNIPSTTTNTTTTNNQIIPKTTAAAATVTTTDKIIPKTAAAIAAVADKIVQKDAATTNDNPIIAKTATSTTAVADKIVQKDATTTTTSNNQTIPKTAAAINTAAATDKIAQKDTTTAATDKIVQKDTISMAAATNNTNQIVQKDASAAATTTTNEMRKVKQDIVHQGLPNPHSTRVAGLNCDKFGGPSPEAAQEMVYWEDIPNDAKWISPFHYKHRQLPTQYMTFEPDQGGWNNIRMAMETVLGMAFAMGRTLVLPPHQKMYLLNDKAGGQRNAFSFEHFFHMERIHEEHTGLDIISMKEFLEIVMQGTFIDPKTKQPVFPPGNRTDWDGANDVEQAVLKQWLRNGITSTVVRWNPEECLAAFPATADPADMESLNKTHQRILDTGGIPPYTQYIGKPNPVNASVEERLKENAAERTKLCLYDKPLQDARWLHFPMEHRGEMQNRLLVHFYAFLFFQDWKTDLWMKRFIRDHVRYIDEIQCAAARVVQAIRKRVQKRGIDTDFDTLHVRRGDFQYTVTRSEAQEIYEMTSQKIPDNTTLYIATDERNKTFFDPLKKHYDVVFLDDFMDVIEGVNSNYFGMIDQLVSSRGRVFYGCWFSTFTGYINRLRGYHADDHETPGYQDGIIPSYYYALKDRFLHMQEFYPVKKSFYAREFPTSWRLIDTGLDD